MILEHKVYELVDAEGKEAEISEIENLKILVNGWDYDVNVVPNEKEQEEESGFKEFIKEAVADGNILEAYSIFEKFEVSEGCLKFKNINISFFDNGTAKELFVRLMREPSLLMRKLHTHVLSDEQTEELVKFLSELAEKGVREVESQQVEVTIKDEPTTLEEEPKVEVKEEVKVEEPVAVAKEPKVEEPVAVVEEPVAVVEEVKVEEPIAVVEEVTPVAEQSLKQMEEIVIPDEVVSKYNEYKNDLSTEGYKEHIYKNYRLLELPTSNGVDAFLLLLTTEGVMQVKPLHLYDSDDANIIKYKFKLDGEKKSLYLNVSDGTIVVKKPKKSELNAKPIAEAVAGATSEVKEEVKAEVKEEAKVETAK